MNQNICRFIPHHKDYQSIHTINFVLETLPQPNTPLKSQSVYKMYYVCGGTGFLHTLDRCQELVRGDIFFTFPASPFCIESGENFSYMYISFLGARANMIMEKLKITKSSYLFHECGEAEAFWREGLSTAPELADLISESVLLYTFAYLGARTMAFEHRSRPGSDTALLIKKFIDDNFSDPGLTLETISTGLSYNKKYISTVFKKDLGVGVIAYLNTVRVQHACALIEQGFTSVSDIATCCGYADPQYFSKVFKAKLGCSPGAYIQSRKNGG